MVGQLTRVELNLHQMGLTSLVSAPENLANSGGRNALRSKQVAFNQTSFLLILPLTALQTSSCAPDCLCPGFGGHGYGAAQGAAHDGAALCPLQTSLVLGVSACRLSLVLPLSALHASL